MKIRPEHLEALKQEQSARKPSAKEGTSFQDILSTKIEHSEKSAAPCQNHPRAMAGFSGLDPLTLSSLEVTPTRQKVMEALDSVLSRWDAYSKNLGSADPDLRQAYQFLEKISSDIRTLKESELTENNKKQFGPILDELEILTVTEQIKFNRGDYI
jgi:hypothetical protein